MKLVLRGLPGDVTAVQIQEYMQRYGGAKLLELTSAGNATRATAEVEMDISAAVAQVVCDRIRQTPFQGHVLHAELLLFFD